MAEPQNKESDKKDTAPTPEELTVLAQANRDAWFTDSEPEPKKPQLNYPEPSKAESSEDEKKEEEDKKEEGEDSEKKAEEKPEDEKEPKKETEKKPEKKSAPAPKAILDEEDYERVAEVVQERLKKKAEPKEDDGQAEEKKPATPAERFREITSNPAEVRILETLQYMSEHDPRYKGRDLVKETADFWKKEQAYIAAWEKKNEGEPFNVDAPEHAAFYAANDVKVPMEEIDSSREQMIRHQASEEATRKAREIVDKKVKEKLDPIEQQRELQQAMPKIEHAAYIASESLVRTIPEFDEILGENPLTAETVEKLRETNPVALEIIEDEAKALRACAGELARMVHAPNHFKFDVDQEFDVGNGTIRAHKEIQDTLRGIEEFISDQPEQDQVDEHGRRFITRVELAKRKKSIQDDKSLGDQEKLARFKALQRKYYFVTPEDLLAGLVEKSSVRVRKSLDRVKKHEEFVLSKKAGKAPEKNGEATRKVDDKSEEKPAKSAPKSAKVNPPPAATGSDKVDTRVPGESKGKSQAEINRTALFD